MSNVRDEQIRELGVLLVETEAAIGSCLHLYRPRREFLNVGVEISVRNEIDPAITDGQGDFEAGAKQFTDQLISAEDLQNL